MRRFTSFLIIIFVLAGLTVWVASRLENAWGPALKFELETTAAKALDQPVHIAHLRYQFPLTLRLLQVDAQPLFQADEIQVRVGLINLPAVFVHGNIADCVSFVLLKHPRLHVTRPDTLRFQRPSGHLKTAKFAPSFFGIGLEDGEITFNDVRLDHMEGEFNWRGPEQSLTLDARSPLLEAFHADYLAFGHHWKSTLTLQGVDLQNLLEASAAFTGTPALPNDLRLAGLIDLSLKASGRKMPQTLAEAPRFITSLRWQATHGKILFKEDQIPWSTRGSLENRGDVFSVEKGAFHLGQFSGGLSGVVKPAGALSQFQLQMRGNPDTDIDSLMRLIHLPHILQGTGDFILRLNGSLKEWRLTAQAVLPQARLGSYSVTRVTALARYGPAKIWELLDSSFQLGPTGRIRTQGTLSADGPSLHATIEDVSIKELYPAALGGSLSGAVTMDGAWDDWQLRGSWWLSHLAWKDAAVSPDWRGDFEMDRTGQLTLAGETADQALHLRARAAYDRENLHVMEAVLELPGGEKILGAGNAAFQKKSADFLITSDRLSLHGQTLQHLKAQGTWAAPSLRVKLEGQQHADQDKDPVPAFLSGDLHFRPRHMAADHLSYARHNLTIGSQLTAEPGAAWIPFAGSATVTLKGSDAQTLIPITYKGRLESDHPNHGSAQLTSGPVQAMLDWKQWNDIMIKAHLDRGGWNTTSMRMDVSGHWTPDEPSSFTVHGVSEPNGKLDAAVSLNGRRISIAQATFRTPESRLEILPGGTIDFPEEGDLQTHFSANLRNLHLGFLTLFGSLDVNGKWAHEQDHPVISAQARTHSLFINDYELEEGRILADFEQGILRFTNPAHSPGLIQGAVNFQRYPQLTFDHLRIAGKEGQELDIQGEVGPGLWNYALEGQGLDLGTLGELAGLPLPMTGAADLKIVGRGDESHPEVQGHARIQKGSIANVRYESGETDFVWQGDRITFQNLQLKDSHRYTAIGGGVFPIQSGVSSAAPPPEINFTVRLENTNLGLLQSMFPEIKSAGGNVDGLVQIQGTLQDPTYRGHLRIENGQVTGAHYFRRLDNITVSADFNHDRLHIAEIRGRSGKGELRVAGDIELAGFYPSSFTLTAETLSKEPVEVDVPELAIPNSPLANRFKFLTSVSRVNVQGRVTFTGPAEAPVFQGDLTLSNGHFTFPPSAKKPQTSALTVWARRIYWDLALHFKDEAWFENELVEANVNGGFKIKGPSDALIVDGGLTIPKGKISYLGLQFDIREARFDMKSGTAFLSGEADSQVQALDNVGLTGGVNTAQRFSVEDTITLTIPYGPLDQIKPRLTSAADPGLSQEKVVARVTQMDVENLTPEERNYLYQQQAVSLIDNSLTTPLAQKVLKRTGIADRFRAEHVFDPSAAPPVDPITGQPVRGTTASDLFANTKYTVEKDVMGNLSVGYGLRFVPTYSTTDANSRKLDMVSDVEMAYHAFKNVYVRANYDLPNSDASIVPDKRVTIEPRWRFGWWGNTNKPKPAATSAGEQ